MLHRAGRSHKLCVFFHQGFIIAFVSEFIPRLYFQWSKGKDGSLEGYLDTSLSCFDTRDYPMSEKPNVTLPSNNSCGLGLPSCRYVSSTNRKVS